MRRPPLPWIIYYLGFNYTFVNTVIYPTFPEIERSLLLSSLQLSLISSIPGLISILLQPAAGWLSDRVNRRTILILALCAFASGGAIVAVALALGEGFVWILLGRLVMGIGELGAFPQYLAVVHQALPRELHRQTMAVMEATTSLGAVVAPPIGGILVAVALGAPFWMTAAAALLAIVAVLIGIPSLRLQAGQESQERKSGRGLAELIRAWPGFVGGFLVMGTLVAMQTFLGSFARATFDMGFARLGLFLAVVPLFMAMGSWLQYRAGPSTAFLGMRMPAIGLLTVMGCGLVALATSEAILFFGLAAIGIALGYWLPALDHVVSQAGDPVSRGFRLSVFQQAKAVGIFFLPIATGLTIDLTGSIRVAYLALGVIVFVFGSGALASWRRVLAD